MSLIPAAQYLRISTEHQKFSLENQTAAVRLYAENKNFNVVKTYVDVGKTGAVLSTEKVLLGCCATWSREINPIE